MRDEAQKPTKSRNDPSVGSMHEETVTETLVVKRAQRQSKKAPKSPEFVKMESDDSDDEEKKNYGKKNTETAQKSTKVPKTCRHRPRGLRRLC